MKEILKEVFSSISQHKTRSLLTGFGITWGIFILIVLLGAGNGFQSGILNMFSGYASNSIWVTGYRVSIPDIGGMQAGANVTFDEDIIRKLRNRFPQIRFVSSEIGLRNIGSIKYLDNSGYFDVKGIQEDYMDIKLLDTEKGRFFNKLDYKEKRRVVIIGKRVKEILFENKEPIGKSINISGIFFKVIGVLEEGTVFMILLKN